MKFTSLLFAFPVPGTDPLADLLRRGEVGPGLLLAGCALAFALGAVHALSPGHGKTIVAAYLVGTRGTPRHAVLLGGVVTCAHTVSVFALGLGTLFLSRYVLPEKIYPVLGAVSGLSIVWIGALLFVQRLRHLRAHRHHHHHHHHDHAHVPEEISLAGLVALGAGGGLVPCPSALVLLLSAVALGRVGLGLILLLAFSAGLAVVLTAIGLAALYARRLLPGSAATHPLFGWLPVISAGVITCVGVLMTAAALGWVRIGL
jgi:nickel/cobalt exporter